MYGHRARSLTIRRETAGRAPEARLGRAPGGAAARPAWCLKDRRGCDGIVRNTQTLRNRKMATAGATLTGRVAAGLIPHRQERTQLVPGGRPKSAKQSQWYWR